jgi:hypothetical protein
VQLSPLTAPLHSSSSSSGTSRSRIRQYVTIKVLLSLQLKSPPFPGQVLVPFVHPCLVVNVTRGSLIATQTQKPGYISRLTLPDLSENHCRDKSEVGDRHGQIGQQLRKVA